MDRWPNNLPINGHAKGAGELLNGPERRRRWSLDDKARIVAESLHPDAVASEIARRHGLHRNQLYAWRREVQGRAADAAHPEIGFAPVVVTEEIRPSPRQGIEIVLGAAVVRVANDVDPVVLTRILKVLKRV